MTTADTVYTSRPGSTHHPRQHCQL